MSPIWFRTIGFCGLLVALGFLLPGHAQAPKGKKYALLVGVTEYDSANFSALNYTCFDAEEMAVVLKKAGFDSVRVLTNPRGEKKKLDDPTIANLRAELKKLLENKKKYDLVLIGLAGHGVQLDVTDPADKGDPKPYLYFCPKDASKQGISYSTGRAPKLLLLDDLFDQLGKCDAGQKLALIDACRNEDRVKAGERKIDTKKVTVPDGVGVLFSCGRGQTAWETKALGKKGHGVFFHYAIEGLRGKAKDDEGVVTWDSLSNYVKRQVSREVPKLIGGSAKQSPASMGNLEGQSAVLASISIDVPPPKDGSTPIVKSKGPIVNSVGMKFEYIKPGKYQRGSPDAERNEVYEQIRDFVKDGMPGSLKGEGPRREVEITKGFHMSVHEVTQKQWKVVMGTNPSFFSKDGGGEDDVAKIPATSLENFPVEMVSYFEVEKFIEKLNAKEKGTGRGYRLPTEAEWEYCCRAGASSEPFNVAGKPSKTLSAGQANFNGEQPFGGTKGKSLKRTEEVGTYKLNAWNLHDMHGNVVEWVSDWYDEASYANGVLKDPTGPTRGTERVIRGGGWDSAGRNCRAATRSRISPKNRYPWLGFRLVVEASK